MNENPDEFLDVCDECGETTVIREGRCKTCLNCGNSTCEVRWQKSDLQSKTQEKLET